MSYAFEDYDAFLASFNNPINNINNMDSFKSEAPNNQEQQQQQQQQQFSLQQQKALKQERSLNNSISTESSGILDPYYDFATGTQNGSLYLSPDSIVGTSNSSSPNETQINNGANASGYGFNPVDNIEQLNYDQDTIIGSQSLKQESISSNSSSTSPIPLHHQNARIKLSEALPHGGSISKRVGKKEKSSHNMIEKRYRTNINDKINALRDAVPALRVLVVSGDDEVDDELDGLQPAKKLNKATILSKATEYIKHLESKNDVLRKENDLLKNRLYGIGNGNITPESSVSSYSGERPMQRANNSHMNNNGNANQNQGNGSYTNKFLLGGLACMVGAGLNDDLNGIDSTRSLFAVPVFSFNQQGATVLGKPLLILLKIALVLSVLLNFVFPTIFQSKSKKGEAQPVDVDTQDIEDVRNFSKTSIWKTFQIGTKDDDNNKYVKTLLIRCFHMKLEALKQGFFYSRLINIYVEHVWNYLKQVKLKESGDEHEALKLILSVSNKETIHNGEYLKKLLNFELKFNMELEDFDEIEDKNQFSIIHIIYQMINESKTNSILTKFMNATIDSTFNPIDSKTLSDHEESINVELTTLFNPTDENISKLKENLSKMSLNEVQNNELFIMYASIIQNLIFIKKDFKSASKWLKKLNLSSINEFNLLGFTSLYIIVLSMIQYPESYQDDEDTIFQIEEISGILRIWLGSNKGIDNTNCLKFEKRSKLIEFFVNVNLKLNGLESLNGNLKSIVV